MNTYIKGDFKTSIYNNNNYVIGIIKVIETNIDNMKQYIGKTITFTGYFQELNPNDTYILYGEDIIHPKYGFQFQTERYERVMPEDKEGIIAFLSSDLFSGIGKKIATNIVETLGENTIQIILEDKSSLYKVPNLSSKKIDMIYETLSKDKNNHQTIIELNNMGFSNKESQDIYNRYLSDSINIVNNNIYRLIEEISIPFKKIDEIFLKNNKNPLDQNRIKALIYFSLQQEIYKTGNTYIYEDVLYDIVYKYLKNNISKEQFKQLSQNEKIVIIEDKYYLKSMYQDEQFIVNRIKRLLTLPLPNYKVNNYIEKLETELKIKYSDKQKEAITSSLNNNISIITGGPGTGKTTIIKAICEIYAKINNYNLYQLDLKVALLAPTGRASKRMNESTSLSASTIHRFLKWNKEDDTFLVNINNVSPKELIIIDEASMIDLQLFSSLLKGLSSNAKIIIVGDYNQLPSVGPGTVLKDLIDSKMIKTTYLDLLYRQSENSYINVLAQDIKDGNLGNFQENKDDYLFIKTDKIVPYLKHICQLLTSKYDYKSLQIMAPMYLGENGIDNLNSQLQDIFNPKDEDKRELVVGNVIYRENDKILQLVNMPEENIYNGDIGVIKYIIYKDTSKSGKDEIHVSFDGNLVCYTPKDFLKIKHGYTISIHKSQGSEFKVVVIPICGNYKRMLYRKLIYTGITRAKNKLIIVGNPDSFIYSISDKNEYIRNSNLCEKLINMYNK